ncbi:MAG TPA: HAMP domain-containing protein, partial [Cyclobacteriaceae bacterium]
MFRNIKISAKITGLVFLLTLIAVTAISFFTYTVNLQANQDKYANNLSVVADNRAGLLNTYIEKLTFTLSSLQNSEALKSSLASAGSPDASGMDMMGGGDSTTVASNPLNDYLLSLKDTHSFREILITDKKGLVVASTDPKIKAGNSFADPDGSFFSESDKNISFSVVKKEEDKYFFFGGASVDAYLLIAKIDLTEIFKQLLDTHGLGNTGETIIAKMDPVSKSVILVNPLRNDPGAAIKRLNGTDDAVKPILFALEGKPGSGLAKDYRNNEVVAAWRKINGTNWALVTKIDSAEINGQSKSLINTYIFGGLAIILTAVALSMVFARSITQPLNSMRNTLEMVSKGVLPEKEENHSRDEFGRMADKVDELVDMLKTNAQFAQKVGEGKFDADFNPASENDTLGLSLINMRNNLIENERRDTERNWIVRGVAEVGEILRLHDTLDTLGDDVIKFIIEKTGAIQGAFYVVNDDSGEKLIEMRASFAYNRKKYLKKSFRFAEGLVGQAAIEQDAVMRTEIPDDYMSLTSGIL